MVPKWRFSVSHWQKSGDLHSLTRHNDREAGWVKQGQAQSPQECFRKVHQHGSYRWGIPFRTALRFVLFYVCIAISPIYLFFFFPLDSLLSEKPLRNTHTRMYRIYHICTHTHTPYRHITSHAHTTYAHTTKTPLLGRTTAIWLAQSSKYYCPHDVLYIMELGCNSFRPEEERTPVSFAAQPAPALGVYGHQSCSSHL